jgi:hypothetical protein
MRHDLNLARAVDSRPPAASAYIGLAWATVRGRHGYWKGFGVRVALLAFWLVPGRFLVVMVWPAAAPFLGFHP